MNATAIETIDLTKRNVQFNRQPDLVGSVTLFRLTCLPIFQTKLGDFEGKSFLPITCRTMIPRNIPMGERLVICAIPPCIEVVFGWRCDPNEGPNGAMMCDF